MFPFLVAPYQKKSVIFDCNRVRTRFLARKTEFVLKKSMLSEGQLYSNSVYKL